MTDQQKIDSYFSFKKDSTLNPKFLILYSLPKVGKTASTALLNNSLILDLEEGTDFVKDVRVEKIKTLLDLFETIKKLEELKNNNIQFDYIVIDTATPLIDLANEYGVMMYRKEKIGKNFEGKSCEEIPNTLGHKYLREAFVSICELLKKYVRISLILNCHVKDKLIPSKSGEEEVNVKDLSLPGKLSSIVASRADAIGYMYREQGSIYVKFESTESSVSGSRSKHLDNKTILLSEYNSETDDYTTDWTKIFKV